MSLVGIETAFTSAGNQNFSVPLPAGVQNGHLLVAGYNVGGLLAITPPPGWSVFVNDLQINGGQEKISVVYRVMASGVTAPQWSLESASVAKACGFCVALAGRNALPVFGAQFTRSA